MPCLSLAAPGADAACNVGHLFRSTGASLANGLDIEMPNGVFYTEDKIQAAIENKTIAMAVRARASARGSSRACVRACTM
jgi:hypothetical protein